MACITCDTAVLKGLFKPLLVLQVHLEVDPTSRTDIFEFWVISPHATIINT